MNYGKEANSQNFSYVDDSRYAIIHLYKANQINNTNAEFNGESSEVYRK